MGNYQLKFIQIHPVWGGGGAITLIVKTSVPTFNKSCCSFDIYGANFQQTVCCSDDWFCILTIQRLCILIIVSVIGSVVLKRKILKAISTSKMY